MRWFRLQGESNLTHYVYGEDRILIQNLRPEQSHYFFSTSSFQLFDLCKFSVEIFLSESHEITPTCTLFISDDLKARFSLATSQLLMSQLLDCIKNNDANLFYCLIKDPKDLEDFSLKFLKGDFTQNTFVKNIDEFKLNTIDLLTPN